MQRREAIFRYFVLEVQGGVENICVSDKYNGYVIDVCTGGEES